MKKWCGCVVNKTLWALVVIGGLNWGLVGISSWVGTDLNVVKLILGSYPTIENLVYVIVGIATVASLIGCRCKKCQSCNCTDANCTHCKM